MRVRRVLPKGLSAAAAVTMLGALLVVNAPHASAAVDPSWAGWSEVPGGGTTYDAPSAAIAGLNDMYVYVRGTNDRVYLNRWTSRSRWPGWSEVPGDRLTYSALGANSAMPASGVYRRGTDDRIYSNTATNADATTWTGWSEIPGGGRTPDAPVVAKNSGELFVRGTYNGIHTNRQVNGAWTGWSEPPGGGRTLSAPAAADTPVGMFVVVRGTDNGLWYNVRTSSGWSGWGAVPGGRYTYSAPAAVIDDFGHLYVFIRGTDNRIYYTQHHRFSRTWSAWSELAGNGFTLSAPTAVFQIFGLWPQRSVRMVVFVRGTDNRIYYNFR